MKFNIFLLSVCLALTAVMHAQPFDGLTQQQREWRFQEQIRDEMKATAEANRRISENMKSWAGVGENIRKFFEEKEAIKQRSREEARAAHLRAVQQRKEDEARRIENERSRAQLEATRRRLYQTYLASGGRGTKEVPPHFYDGTQAFQWYLKQAEAGDAHAAFYVGRAYTSGGDEAKGAQWLAKSDLSNPRAAALYGSLLMRGAGVGRDVERGKQLLQKAALEDQSGYAAQLYSNLLQSGPGGPDAVKNAIVQLGRAAFLAETPALIESIDMTAPWDENMPAREQRRRGMRDELKQLARTQPDAYIAAVEEVRRGKDHSAYGVMMGVVGEMERQDKHAFYLAFLNTVETRATSFDFWARREAISALERSGVPEASARTLLPDGFNRTANSFIPLQDDEAQKLWESHAATIEKWSSETGELAPRAVRALVAREMGRWPKVSPRQSPRAVLDKMRALKAANPLEVLTGEVLDGVFTANPQWTDKEKSLQWLDELIALDASFKELRGFYLSAPALQSDFYRTDDPIVLALREAQDVKQEFTPAQLDASEAERNAAAMLLYSDPQAAFNGLLKALKGGDALAGWQLLRMAEGKFLNILKQRQRLLDLTDARLQRDVQRNDDRGAGAALALHFLHNPEAVGRQWQRSGRVSQPSTRNWLQLAEEKGHPWALFHSAAGYDAASKARDRHNAEAQKIWTWLAQNYDALNKTELWQRDAQLLELFPVERDIESLQAPLRAIERLKTEASRYADTSSRLASARELLMAYEKTPAALDSEQAEMLYEASAHLEQRDQDTGELLPSHRAERLELLVQSSILGHAFAPLSVGALLKEPGFPLAPQPDEAAHWLDAGQSRLMKLAQSGAPADAMGAAFFLATEFRSGETFARDDAHAMKYFALAATLGHQKSASILSSAYRFGGAGVAKDAAEQRKWETIAEEIAMGRYKIPTAAIAGRPKDKARP